MNTTYNFIDIFQRELDYSQGQKVKISKILIPKIQRPYAQGRKDSYTSGIRKQFVKEIFNALCDNKPMELNFIYGFVKERGKDVYVMELIDGQQRLTTLFILYWYIANQELNAPDDELIRETLKKLSYETRTTSTLFCQKLASTKITIPEDSTPSKEIRKSRWYFKSFDLDSTICGMLTMLDAIHEQYKECKRTDLHLTLHNIQFYFHSLGCYGLSEELYIKMNARGLQLTPFENFKAALINFILKNDFDEFDKHVKLHAGSGDVTFKDNFAIKIDSKWIDLFWQKNKDFDSAYLKFFTRYLACKYILSKDAINDKIRQDETLKALYTDIESSEKISNNITFDTIESILKEHPEFIIGLDKVLDTFYQNGRNTPNTNSLIYEQMLAIWDRSEEKKGDDFYCTESKITHIKLITLSAVTSFIETFDNFDETIFKEWMRVVWNIIENTNIDSLTPTSNLIRKFNEIIKNIESHTKEGKSFYEALSQYELATNEGRAVVEEVRKAKLIAEDNNWLTIFKDAEKHPFFKGMVLFFYRDGMSIEDYTKAYRLVKDMFDEKGISPSYRKEHLLIRAIISHYNKWEGGNLYGRYITEDSDNNKYLKNILAAKDEVRNMFADIAFVADKESEVKTKLNNYIEKATKAINDNSDNKYLTKAINTLLNNVSLYQWTSSINGTFRAWGYGGHIMLAVPNRWYDKVAIDTDRAKIAWSLSVLYKLQFDNDDQFKTIRTLRKYGICPGNEIWLKRTINNRILWVGLLLEHKVRISISCNTKEDANELLSKMDDFQIRHNDPKTIALESLEHFDYNETIKAINAELDRVIPILEQAKD